MCGESAPTHLLRLEASETKHANLVGDVLPVVGRPLFLQVGHQLGPHANDAVGHAFHFLQPVGKQRAVLLWPSTKVKSEATAFFITSVLLRNALILRP